MGLGDNFVFDDDSEKDRSAGVRKQERDIDRPVQPQGIRNFASQTERVQSWEQDPVTLKDYSENIFVESFIDQVAKDVASTDYTVEIGDEKHDEAVRFLEQADPRYTFKNLIEATVRELLKTGNAFWFLNEFEENDNLAEALVVDSQHIFVVTDEDGFPKGYVQKRRGADAKVVDIDNVVHFRWSVSADRYYGRSPVESAMETIEILDELQMKEILDLREGSQSGVVAVDDHKMDSQEWNRFTDELTRANEGERHKISVVEGNLDFVNFSSNYDELQVEERYQKHIQALSSAFKVSPSYVGFNIGEGGIGQGRAREESRENHREGISTVIEQIESKIDREIIKKHFDEEARFKFDVTDQDDDDKVEYMSNLAEAVMKLREAGISVRVEDDSLVVPDDVELDAISQDLVQEDEKDEDFEEKPEQIDECVQSILEDNPDMSESEAFAICNDQFDVSKEIPDKYLNERDEDFFIPNDTVAEEARQALDWEEEHDDEIDAFGGDGEGLRRARQIVEHNENDEALDIEYWNEIDNFHSRHHAQGNHELDEEFEGEPWKDNGYISHLAWGGDPGFEQAQRVMNLVEEVEQRELQEKEDLTERQAELCYKMDMDSLGEALRELEDGRNRSEAFQEAEDKLTGMSKSTYYEWLDQTGLR